MIKVNELFAGIGAFRKALERLNIPHEIVGISEIDKYASSPMKLSMVQLETTETSQRSQNSTMPIYGLTVFRVRTSHKQVIKQESLRARPVVVSCMKSNGF